MNVLEDKSIGSLSRRLGTGLSEGLGRLAESKWKQIEERHGLKKYTNVGYSPEEAAFIQGLPEKNRWEASQALAPQRQQQRQHTEEEQQFMQTLPEHQRAEASQWLLQQQQQTPEQYAQEGIPEQMSGLSEFTHQMRPNNEAVHQQIGQQRQQQMQQQGQQQSQQPLSFGEKLRGGAKVNPAVQARIDRSNAPYNKVFSKAYENAEEIHDVAKEMQGLWNTGKVASGAAGSLQGLNIHLQNNETQEFNKLSKQLAQKLSSQSGLPTKFKIQYAEEQKPSLSQNRDVQEYLINGILKDTSKIIGQGRIREDLIAANDYNQPDNLETRVAQAYRQQRGQPRDQQESQAEQMQSQQPMQGNEESPLGTAARATVRTASRVGETLAGGIGDIASGVLGLTNWATGGKTPTYEDVQNYLPISAPTSNQIKETISGITGGYTDPKAGWETVMDDVFSTAAALIGPGKGKLLAGKIAGRVANPQTAKAITTAAKYAFPFSATDSYKKALTIGAAGAGAGQFAKAAGAGPVVQAATKLVAMTAASIPGTRKAMNDLMAAEYQASRDSLRRNSGLYTAENTLNAKGMIDEVESMAKGLSKQPGPDQEMIRQIIGDVGEALESTAGGKDLSHIPVGEMTSIKEKLNEWIKLGYKPRVAGEKYLPESARQEVQKMSRLANEELSKFGKRNPAFGEPYARAEELWKGLNVHDDATKFLNDHVTLKGTLKSSSVKGGALAVAGWFGLPYAAGGILAAKALKDGALLRSLVSKSPIAHKYVDNLWKHAALHDSGAVAKDLAQIGGMLEYEQRKEKKS